LSSKGDFSEVLIQRCLKVGDQLVLVFAAKAIRIRTGLITVTYEVRYVWTSVIDLK
jgi:hypothetical protein